MLAKRFKYDFRRNIGFFLVVYAIMFVVAIIGRLLEDCFSSMFTYILSQVFQGMVWAGVANLFINNLLRLWADFRRNVYGDEAYLTHTLPVKTETIFWSKWLNGLAILLLNIAVSVASVLIAYGHNISIFSNALAESILMLGLIAIEIFAIFCEGILGIILEHRKTTKKSSLGVIYGLVAYVASQICVLVVIPLSALFNPDVMNIFSGPRGIMDWGVLKTILIIGTIAYTLVITIVSLLSAKKIKDGINID